MICRVLLVLYDGMGPVSGTHAIYAKVERAGVLQNETVSQIRRKITESPIHFFCLQNLVG